MARLPVRQRMNLVTVLILQLRMMEGLFSLLLLLALAIIARRRRGIRRPIRYADQLVSRHNLRSLNLHAMAFDHDRGCVHNCRMDRHALTKLCHLLKTVGCLRDSKNMNLEEMVVSFLHILAHNIKNRIVKRQVVRSGETISRQFHTVLKSVLRLHSILFRKPEPIPENSTDDRWKWFKGCLGALDGTFVKVHVDAVDKPRYRNRKGEIATNVLGVCTPDMQFIYVLPGWEGSAADGRVLRDAISRRNGLKIPQGN